MNPTYETVVGLEVHAELKTSTKIFCACSTAFGAKPSSQCCPVCLGLPGGMPVLNRRAVELAVMAGLALNCEVSRVFHADRKQYFYPDLPKGYQISQAEPPLCKNGWLIIPTADGGERRVRIKRIHIEEDAGKLTHEGERTLIDHNRCGVPLVEIVSEPDLRSGAEAAAYARALRDILLYAGISDCRMQEGSLRCDVNVSVRRRGEALGTRTEIKNINSFSFVEKAINYEAERQIALLERGEAVLPQTRRFDERSGETVLMRVKESAEDYRYLIEPDLLAVALTEEEIASLADALPELPRARAARLEREYGMGAEEAAILTSERALADYYETAARASSHADTVRNLLLSELLRVCTQAPFASPVSAERLASLADLVGEGTVNSATAKKLLSRLCREDFSPREVVEREGLAQITDREVLASLVENAVGAMPRAVVDYRNGKKAALQALLGRVMAESRGRAAPEICEQLLLERLHREDEP